MDDKILITKEDGTEVEMTILFTYENEETGRKYVLYYDPEDENGDVHPYYYLEEDNSLHELETEEEWAMASEVLEAFLGEEE